MIVGSNYEFRLTSEGKEHFKIVMGLAFENCPGKKAKTFGISDKYGLVFAWSDTNQVLENGTLIEKLPFVLDLEGTTEFAWNWLKTADYGKEPDHDGDNKKGFIVYNEYFGSVGNCPYAFVGIQPEWIMYGK